MSEFSNIFNMYKRESNYKDRYIIKDKTHLINVVNAIIKFPDLKEEISNYKSNKNLSIEIENENKLINLITPNIKELLYKLINIEKTNKEYLIKAIDNKVLNNEELEYFLSKNIKTQTDGLEYATALGILDDYLDYLETGTYTGPVTKLA